MEKRQAIIHFTNTYMYMKRKETRRRERTTKNLSLSIPSSARRCYHVLRRFIIRVAALPSLPTIHTPYTKNIWLCNTWFFSIFPPGTFSFSFCLCLSLEVNTDNEKGKKEGRQHMVSLAFLDLSSFPPYTYVHVYVCTSLSVRPSLPLCPLPLPFYARRRSPLGLVAVCSRRCCCCCCCCCCVVGQDYFFECKRSS